MVAGVRADAALAPSGLLRGRGEWCPGVAARVGTVVCPAIGGDSGQPDAAAHVGVGVRAGYGVAERRKGSKAHAAIDRLGHLLALLVTPAHQQGRDQVAILVEQVLQVTGEQVEVAHAGQGYSGEQPAAAAAAQGIRLEVIKHP